MQNEVMIIGAVLAVVISTFILAVVLYNRRHRSAIERFRHFAMERNAKIIESTSVRMRFWRTYGMRTQAYPWTDFELFWFGDMLVILRVQQFILNIHHPPVVITSDHRSSMDPSLGFEIHRPSTVRFARHYPGVLDIKLTDKVNEYGEVDIRINGLSPEEREELRVMEDWVSGK